MQERNTPSEPIVQHIERRINVDRPLSRRFTSRKFLALIAGAILGVVGEELGWDRETIASIIALAIAYIAGESYIDGRNNHA